MCVYGEEKIRSAFFVVVTTADLMTLNISKQGDGKVWKSKTFMLLFFSPPVISVIPVLVNCSTF